MNAEVDFSQDEHFQKLLARESCSLTMVNLEIARDSYPGLDFQPTLDWIAHCRDELAALFRGLLDEREQLEIISRSLALDHEISGASAAWKTADGSFLHRVIETGEGIPISLSLLYIEVASQLGLELHGVSSPMHFLAVAETMTGPVYVDAYSGGRLMTEDEATDQLAEMTRLDPLEVRRSLKPADDRTIVIRMLNNLRTLYAEQGDWKAAWPVQNRLVALSPGSYPVRRDLAMIGLRAQHSSTAVRLFRSLLESCPEEDRGLLEGQLAEAVRDVSRWN